VLQKAISAEIRNMYASGAMTTLVKKYGADPDQFLKPTSTMAKSRQGVDRPADWTPPTI
jgi:polar amino acid transport system substrate-binding protein